ncbi:hypothetical protein GCM10023143_04720 [Compostibacter hankyongensis]|uniref:Uncharacterized protein n=2 Tax=Compostibacter hankyongensis TaxID=1007089 RepID=A0ABP8FFX7_9BACT
MHMQDACLHRLSLKEIVEPYAGIVAFFECWGLPEGRKTLSFVLRAATRDKKTYIEDHGDLLFFYENMEKLVESAFLVHRLFKESAYGQTFAAVLEDAPRELFDEPDPALYCGGLGAGQRWDYFPRSLSRREFLDPYQVLEDFFDFRTLPEWREVLLELLSHAFSNAHAIESPVLRDIMDMQRYLHKLLEAAHLIYVREVFEIEGQQIVKYRPDVPPLNIPALQPDDEDADMDGAPDTGEDDIYRENEDIDTEA